jgi:hypothetical protein
MHATRDGKKQSSKLLLVDIITGAQTLEGHPAETSVSITFDSLAFPAGMPIPTVSFQRCRPFKERREASLRRLL